MRRSSEGVSARLFQLSLGVFFIGGFVASAISLLVPRVRLSLGLDYTSAAAIQLASHSSYLLFAVPIAVSVAVIGYMRAHAAGLALMAFGCVLLIGGFAVESFATVLAALLAVSAGASFLQIASNNAVTIVGDPARAAVRLNLLQGFNSLGTVLGPAVGAPFIVSATAWQPGGLPSLAVPFGFAALLLAGLSIAFALNRDLLSGYAGGSARTQPSAWLAALRDLRLMAGVCAIFSYVGAEVTIGALLTDFLMHPHATGLAPIPAARLVALYWGGAMLGRFAGAALMRSAPPPRLLAYAAAAAGACTLSAVLAHGTAAAAALIAVGLFNSIMFPTIYVMALPAVPEQATPGATILCMAVVGGAVIPPLTGMIADAAGLVPSLLLPAACFGVILAFAVHYRTPRARPG